VKLKHIIAFVLSLALLGMVALASAGYIPKVYHKQGGAEMVVASGGKITVQSGGTLSIASGATLTNANVLTAAGVLNTGKYYGMTACSGWSDTTGWTGPKLFIFAAADTIYFYTATHTIKKIPAI
jgi:hypothetical protein